MRQTLLSILLIIVASLFVSRFYLQSGLPGTDDGIWAPVRLGSMYRELRQFQIPVRWSSDLNYGYGYPLFHFSYPGPYYLGALFVPFLGLQQTVKMLFVLGVVSAAVGIYFTVIQLTANHLASISASLLYLSSPYLITNLYRRGSLGEIIAAGVIPWILFVFILIISKPTLNRLVGASILTAILILMHNATALLSLPFLMTFIIWLSVSGSNKARSFVYKLHLLIKTATPSLTTIVIGLMLSAFFWIPAMYDVQFTKIANHSLTNITDWFVPYNKSLFFPFYIQTGASNLHDYYLSIGLAVTIAFSYLTFTSLWQRKWSQLAFIAFLWIGISLLFPITASLWKFLPVYRQIDFPWRLLTPLSIILPIIIASLLRPRFFTVVAALLSCYFIIPRVQYRDIVMWPDQTYATNPATATANNEYIAIWSAKESTTHPPSPFLNSAGAAPDGELQVIKSNSTSRIYQLNSPIDQKLEYQLMYFPGWKILIDSKPVLIDFQTTGRPIFDLKSGTHTISVIWQTTALRSAATLLSVSTMLIMFFAILKQRLIK